MKYNFDSEFGAVDPGTAILVAQQAPKAKDAAISAINSARSAMSGRGFCSGGGVCGGKKAAAAAAAAKAEEVKTKYPTVDCGPNPTVECKAYNDKMLALQKNEVSKYQEEVNKAIAGYLGTEDKQRFEAIAKASAKMKALHPETANMTMKEIYKKYPEEFKQILKDLTPEFPFLKNLTPEDIFAMSPEIANETLDQAIAEATALSGLSGIELAAAGAGGLFLAAIAAWFFYKKK